MLKGLIGTDTREQDTQVTYPNTAVFRIIFGRDTPTASCTAFLIRPYVLMTAGHCVYDPVGRYFFSASVYKVQQKFNASGPTQVERVRVLQVATTREWMTEQDYSKDIGLIFLDSNLGKNHGWFPITYTCDQEEYSLKTVGYPGDKSSGLPYETTCGVSHRTCADSLMPHTCDTFSGQSGSPMFTPNDYMIRAVHTCELPGDGTNCGVMIRPAVWPLIQSASSWTPPAQQGAGNGSATPSIPRPGSSGSPTTRPEANNNGTTNATQPSGGGTLGPVVVGGGLSSDPKPPETGAGGNSTTDGAGSGGATGGPQNEPGVVAMPGGIEDVDQLSAIVGGSDNSALLDNSTRPP